MGEGSDIWTRLEGLDDDFHVAMNSHYAPAREGDTARRAWEVTIRRKGLGNGQPIVVRGGSLAQAIIDSLDQAGSRGWLGSNRDTTPIPALD
jgi:hypothetical protein